jgi:vacuolar-type H+-ATPase subunit H
MFWLSWAALHHGSLSIWGNSMSQEIISRILSIERQASKLRDDAQRRAEDIVSQAETEASSSHDQVLAETRLESEQVATAGREAAEAERAQVIARAEAEAQAVEALAAQHFDEAVSFVIRQVAGRE